MRIKRLTWSLAALPSLILLGAAACGSNDSPSMSSFDGGLSDGAGRHDGSSGKGSHDARSLAMDGSGDVATPDACAATSQTAKTSLLDMYILLDRSGSMADNNAWTEETEALTDFVYDSHSAGLGVGIQYMPLQDLCNPEAYAVPAVPIASLPGGTAQIVTSLSNSRPFGGTPTVPALEGVIAAAKKQQLAEPDHIVVIVLSTDGLPDTSCSVVPDGGLPNGTQNAANVIQAAASADPPLKTFVIGIGNEPALDLFAQAGGTGKAILVGAGDAGTAVDIEAPLIAALNGIRTQALPCQYNIPQAEAGTINFGDVNVTFTSGGGDSTPFYGVGKASDCQTGSQYDWYYDNPTLPTHIELCPNACTAVKASTNGTVGVAYGCATLAPPVIK